MHSLQYFIIMGLIGIAAGWAAGQFTKGRGFGLAGNLVVGLFGALIGGYLFGLLGFHFHGWIGQGLVAVVGAVIFVVLIGFIKR